MSSPDNRAKRNTRYLIGGAAAVVVVVGISVALLLRDGSENAANEFVESTRHLSGLNEMLVSRIAESETVAQSWREDAYLTAVDIYFDDDLTVSDQYSPIAYFASFEDEFNNDFYVEINPDLNGLGESGEEIRAEEYVGVEIAELTNDEWEIGFDAALAIGEEAAGAEFRSNHSKLDIIMEITRNNSTGLEWTLFYGGENSGGTYELTRIFIDPSNGNVKAVRTN